MEEVEVEDLRPKCPKVIVRDRGKGKTFESLKVAFSKISEGRNVIFVTAYNQKHIFEDSLVHPCFDGACHFVARNKLLIGNVVEGGNLYFRFSGNAFLEELRVSMNNPYMIFDNACENYHSYDLITINGDIYG